MASDRLIIERLNRNHDLSGFDCGNPQLSDWLIRFAWSNDRAESARTYIAHRANRAVGYHSLVAGSVLRHEAPAPNRKRSCESSCRIGSAGQTGG